MPKTITVSEPTGCLAWLRAARGAAQPLLVGLRMRVGRGAAHLQMPRVARRHRAVVQADADRAQLAHRSGHLKHVHRAWAPRVAVCRSWWLHVGAHTVQARMQQPGQPPVMAKPLP